MNIPGAFKRLWGKITGTAERTVSKIKEFITGLFSTGASEKTIKTRLDDEIKNGSTELSELQQFATKILPGFITDAIFDTARDTLTDRQKKIEALKDLIAQKASELDAPELDKIFKEQGIDATAMLPEQLDIPVEALPSELFVWLAIEDKNTCDICGNNHLVIKTLEQWADVGLPRAGACRGGSYCRCILVPSNVLSDDEKTALSDLGPLNIPK